MNPPADQQVLAVGNTLAYRNHDYLDLFPPLVFPTGNIDILERGDHLLLIKTYNHKKKIATPHRKIYRLLARHGKMLEGPGTITVACVWGIGPTSRELVVFDELGESEPKMITRDEWREWLSDWWRTHRGYR